MGFYVQIKKSSENDSSCEYEFIGDSGHSGLFEINKSTGEVNLIKPMDGDSGERAYMRASTKIKKEWKEGRLPNVTEFAS